MSMPSIPQGLTIQQGNGNILIQWQPTPGVGIASDIGGYNVWRADATGIFSLIATVPPIPAPSYTDMAMPYGDPAYYYIEAYDSTLPLPLTSPRSATVSAVPTQNGEMSLGELRNLSQLRADRLNSDFVTDVEWNSNINQSLLELYDLLITAYEDYFVADPFLYLADGIQYRFALPDGQYEYVDEQHDPVTPSPFYKLMGCDLAVNNANNAYVTINKFMFIDRNRFVYPNTASTLYGVFNLQYRLVGSNIEFIPTPQAGQYIRIWYIPRLAKLLADYDTATTGVSGWLEYVITDAAIKALQKEESDVSVLMAQKMALIKRIEESAVNRDAGQPDRVSDVRGSSGWGGSDGHSGWNSPSGGW